MNAVRAQSRGRARVQDKPVVSLDVIRMALFIRVPHLYRSALSQLEPHNVVETCLGVRPGNGFPIVGLLRLLLSDSLVATSPENS
jgi:hypothetical protein